VPEPVAQPDPLQGRFGQCPAAGGLPAPVQQPVGDVVQHGQAIEQEELLEHGTQPPGPQPRQLLIPHDRRVLPGDADHPAGGPLQRAHHMQQGALARPGRADDGGQLASIDPQVDPGQRHHRRVAGVLLDHTGQLKDRRRAGGRAGRERDHHGHDDGTSTRVPAVMPGPLTWTRVLLYMPVVTPTRRRAAGHHVHAVPAAGQGQQRVHRHRQHIGGRLRGDVDVHRRLVQGRRGADDGGAAPLVRAPAVGIRPGRGR
jgi:hypothetical protein